MAPIVKSTEKKPLKILLLHGYTSSGPIFYAKSRALQKHLQKHLPTYSLTFSSPSGPLALSAADIPGYTPSSNGQTTVSTDSVNSLESSTAAATEPSDSEPEAFAWWRMSDTEPVPYYAGADQGIAAAADVIRKEGPFDGVIGFSQGAAFAGVLTSLLEPGRREAFDHFAAEEQRDPESGVTGIPFPESISDAQPPFKFAVCYSGFAAPGPRYRAFYEPPIKTPILHVIGQMDAIVEEARSKKLVAACAGNSEAEGRVLRHPGGHFLPSQRPFLDGVVTFVKECIEGGHRKESKDEVSAEDMEMPF